MRSFRLARKTDPGTGNAVGHKGITDYFRPVRYYETDKMGLAHHANYLHWMEEARIDFMMKLGFPYKAMEDSGIFSPVKSVTCRYLKSCTFGDVIVISARPASFNGVVLTMRYEMRKKGGEDMTFEGLSEHVFLDGNGRFVRLKKAMPAFVAAVEGLIGENGI